VLRAEGIESGVEAVAGERAVLEAWVERFPDGSFVEHGTISYGGAGKISFSTLGRGSVGPSPVAGWQRGAVIWTVTEGDGRFVRVQGLITSNFTVDPDGRVTDNHFARLYLSS